jgi:hypothetical protein
LFTVALDAYFGGEFASHGFLVMGVVCTAPLKLDHPKGFLKAFPARIRSPRVMLVDLAL